MNNRVSGILLHPISFIGRYGCGDLGDGAFKIIDFLKKSGQKILQILPLGPTGFGNSPYHSLSSFAGNPYIISFDKLKEKGFLKEKDLLDYPLMDKKKIDYGLLYLNNFKILKRAFQNFKDEKKFSDFIEFCENNSNWLNDYSLFMAIKEKHNGASWNYWDHDSKYRLNPDKISEQLKDGIEFYSFIQWQFFEQWENFKNYAHNNNISIIGDIPIFVPYDSVEVWADKELFHLDDQCNPVYVSGVPPDYFSATGQLWGNPIYKWELMEDDNFCWWKKRIKHVLKLVDCIRIDHFRGFESYWQIHAGEKTAINGSWIKGPGYKFFNSLKDEFGEKLTEIIIAEDLGIITNEVQRLRDAFNLAGMRVFEFADFILSNNNYKPDNFNNDPYLPENYIKNCVAYPGTHDNNTLIGWFKSLNEQKKQIVFDYLGINDINKLNEAVIFKLANSRANRVVFLIQDILGLDSEARFNLPGTFSDDNWSWRLNEEMLNCEAVEKLFNITKITRRD